MKQTSANKLPASFTYSYSPLKAWLYFIFCAAMDFLCVFQIVFGREDLKPWAMLFLLLFLALTFVSAMLIRRSLIDKAALQISKTQLVFPALFTNKTSSVAVDRICEIHERHVPAVLEIYFTNDQELVKRQIMWSDMFRSKEQFKKATELIRKIHSK